MTGLFLCLVVRSMAGTDYRIKCCILQVFGMNHQKATGLFLYCIASALLMAYMLGLFTPEATGFLTEDSNTYLDLAVRGGIDAYRTALYPVLLRALSLLFRAASFLQGVFITQLIVWILTCWMGMLIMLRYLSMTAVLLFSATWLFNPSFVVYTHLVLTETFFLFLLMMATFFLLRKPSSGWIHAITAFALLCLLSLLRPGFLVFVVLFGLYGGIQLIRKKRGMAFLAAVVIFCITIVYPVCRFQTVYHRYSLSFIGDLTVYRYLNSRTLAFVHHTGIGEVMAVNDSIAAQEQALPVWQQVAQQRRAYLSTFRHYPMQSLQAYMQSLISNTHTGNNYLHYIRTNAGSAEQTVFRISRVFNVGFTVLLLLALLYTLWLAINNKRHTSIVPCHYILFLSAVCAFLFFSSGISYWQGDRFHITWMPCCAILCGFLLHIRSQRSVTGMK